MSVRPSPEEHPGAALESPEHYLGTSALLDLQDSKLRLRARSLTQLCKTDREKAMALHNYVKRLTFERPFKLRLRTAREVMKAGRGDAADKSALLVALLRLCNIPARIRFVELRGDIMRGLGASTAPTPRPVVEIWLGTRWVRTDTYIYDVEYVAAARQRLKDKAWEWGYGIHRNGHSIWNGTDDAVLGGFPMEQDPMVLQMLGVFHDPLQFVRSDLFRSKERPLGRLLHVNMLALGMRQVVRTLREEASRKAPRSRSGNLL
ncbi:MAG: transglutaminase-like domain-containing protein [Ramlibacter sp.]|nr:transglutaminase-like domain-containing protein [Ramlibacter sp.]